MDHSFPHTGTEDEVERHFTSLQSDPGFQSHWSPLLSHPSASESRQTDRQRKRRRRQQQIYGTCEMFGWPLWRCFNLSDSTIHHTQSSLPTTFHWPTHSDKLLLRRWPRKKALKVQTWFTLSLRQTHSSSRQELCGTAALCRKSSLGAVAPVLGSESTTVPLCWPRFISTPLPPGSVLESPWRETGGNMQDQRRA